MDSGNGSHHRKKNINRKLFGEIRLFLSLYWLVSFPCLVWMRCVRVFLLFGGAFFRVLLDTFTIVAAASVFIWFPKDKIRRHQKEIRFGAT